MPSRMFRAVALGLVRGHRTRDGAARLALLAIGVALVAVTSSAYADDPDGAPGPAAGTVSPRAALALAHPRATADQPDEKTGSQIHLVYALPSDGVDRALDVNGTIDGSIASAQAWLASQAGGRSLRLDTLAGTPDVSFVRLSQSRATVAAQGVFVRDLIETSLIADGFNDPNKLYLVWYDGLSTSSCGAGPLPPTLPGNTTVLYLQGEPPGAPPCVANPFAAATAPPGYWEFSALHEAMHALGFVPACAPHATPEGHVSEPPNDLMYAGNQPWDTAHMVLDAGHDDYFQHAGSSCPDLADSTFLEAEPSVPVIPAPPGVPLPPTMPPATTPTVDPKQPPEAQPPALLGALNGIPRTQRGAALTGYVDLGARADAVSVEAYVRARLLRAHARASPALTRIGRYGTRSRTGRVTFRIVPTTAVRNSLAAHTVTITLRITLHVGDLVVTRSTQVAWKPLHRRRA